MKWIYIFLLLATTHLQSQNEGTWTWIHGNKVSDAYSHSFGTKGVASPTNLPLARYQCAYWTDLEGNFWIFSGVMVFGGISIQIPDLWKYNVNTNQWTWVSGDTSNTLGSYGTKGIPSQNNYPCGRGWGANCWTDTLGDLWLYGGSSGSTSLNDLWRYRISTNEWTWIDGDKPNATNKKVANYGMINIANNSNFPGERAECKSGWVHNNELIMFGGQTFSGVFNDIWKYSISSNQWTWIGGDNYIDATGNYGSLNTTNPQNKPSARMSYTKWKKDSFIYIFAGGDFNPAKAFNDIWQFNLNSHIWTWIGGDSNSNSIGINPSENCKEANNLLPHSRIENQTIQNTDCSNSFWSFGGFVNKNGSSSFTNTMNDLWLYKLEQNKWIRVNGDSTINGQGSYGTKGVPNSSNLPAGRGGVAIWSDFQNNLYVFGGLCKNSTNNFVFGNDLWRYTPDSACIKYNLNSGLLRSTSNFTICSNYDSISIALSPSADSFKVIPNTNYSFDPTKSIIYLFPKVNTSYELLAYGENCKGLGDTLYANIVIYEKDTVRVSDTGCSGYYFNGQIINSAGIYTANLFNHKGCDSLVILNYTIGNYQNITLNKTICEGQNYFGYNHSGIYIDTIVTSGCDTIRTINLTVIPKDTTIISHVSCAGYNFYGQTLNNSGTYYTTLKNSSGCDSLIQLNFTVSLTKFTIDTNICKGYSFMGYGQTGTYYDTIRSPNDGCDTLIELRLKVLDSIYRKIYVEKCDDDSFRIGNQWVKQSGQYQYSGKTFIGCDSIVDINIWFLPAPNTQYLYFTKCYGFIYDMRVLYKSDTILDTLYNKLGCDSVYRTNYIKIGPPPTYLDSLSLTFCDSILVNKRIYRSSINLYDTTKTKSLPVCDSLLQFISYERIRTVPMNITLTPHYDEYIIGESIELKTNYALNYDWSTGDTTKLIKLIIDENKTIHVIGWDNELCKDTAFIRLSAIEPAILDIPKAFSPNGMKKNRLFKPDFNGKVDIEVFAIFDRWGEKVYETNTINNIGWNGELKGEEMPPGVYSYILRYRMNRATYFKSGEFLLVR